METKTIFLIGKPGCGKGTQGKLLSEKTGWKTVSSGVLFRTIAAEETPIGRKVKSEIDSGLLSPPWFAMYLYLKTLFAVGEQEGIIFDGFNRKVREADLVIDSLHWLNRPFVVLNLVISDEEMRTRLEKRKELENRADDSAIEERMNEYHEHTEPSIEIFRNAGVLIDINGEQSREAIAAEIDQALNIK